MYHMGPLPYTLHFLYLLEASSTQQNYPESEFTHKLDHTNKYIDTHITISPPEYEQK